METQLPKYQNKRFSRSAYNLVELEVAMVILAACLLSFAGLFRIYSLQASYIEKISMPADSNGDPNLFYIISQSNRWMRQLEVPADVNYNAGQYPWTPPVSGSTRFKIRLNSLSKNFDSGQVVADVTLKDVNDANG